MRVKANHQIKILLVFGVALFLSFTACDSDSGSNDGESTAERVINIAMIAKTSTNPVFIAAKEGAEDKAREISEKYSKVDVKVDWQTPKIEDPFKQAEILMNAKNNGYDVVLVSCSDDSILTAAIDSAVTSGVEVMTFDSDAKASQRFAHIGSSDSTIGSAVMEELAQLIDQQGKIAVLGGSPDAPNIQLRIRSVLDVVKKYPVIENIGIFYHAETADSAAKTVLEVMAANPDLAGWAMVGGWPFFDDGLMDKIEPGSVKIVSVDALPQQLPYIENGIVQVMVGQTAYNWGSESVQIIVDKMHFQKDIDKRYVSKTIKVSLANLGGWSRQLRAWGYTGIPVKYIKM
jgi:ribose transport system substrate-binding protein